MTFAEFWSLYPRKRHKLAAERAWNAAVKRFEPAAILSALEEAKREWRGRSERFIPHAATWLRATDFDDEYEAREDDMEPTLFDGPGISHEEAAVRELARALIRWDREAAEHKHTEACQHGKVCRYTANKRPTIDQCRKDA